MTCTEDGAQDPETQMSWKAKIDETLIQLRALNKAAPAMAKFNEMTMAVKKEGPLDVKTKEFVALGIAPFDSTTIFSDGGDGFTSIAEIGLTPGRTVFQLPNDSLTVNIGAGFAQAVPLPGGLALMLGGFGTAGLLLRRRRG